MPAPTTIKNVLSRAKTNIASLDAELLLAHTLDKPRSFIHARPETLLTDREEDRFLQFVQRRKNSEPLAYITGKQEFWSLTFLVNEYTLIPRPETELLVETILTHSQDAGNKALNVLDLGTGSGCIALALARERPRWNITAIDKSKQTLAVARENAVMLQTDNVKFIHSDWFENVPEGNYDIIVSNPPYVAANDPHLKNSSIAYEPDTALCAGIDGLLDIQHIISHAKTYLAPGGLLVLEYGYNQSQTVVDLLRTAEYKDIQSLTDLAGIDRAVVARYF